MRFPWTWRKRPERYGRVDVARALPSYVIGKEIGRGAGSIVYAGRHRRLHWDVAVKQLAVDIDDDQRRWFDEEAKVLALLEEHPHIVHVRDYLNEGPCLLVMERLHGGTVLDRMNDGGFSMPQACSVALGACSALSYVHNKNILHRDIKPENLMFTEKGILKVTDFGIAKLMGEAGGGSAPTARPYAGTGAYMAPEQVQGQELTFAADVYSLATVLYELLARRLPFSDLASIARSRIEEQPHPLLAANPRVPLGLAAVVMQGLATDPADRYPTADAFSDAISTAAADAWGPDWPRRLDFPVSPPLSAFPGPTTNPAPDPPPSGTPRLGAKVRSPLALATLALVLLGVFAAMQLVGGTSGRQVHEPPLPIAFRTPKGVAAATDGTLYVSETDSARILAVRPDRTVTVFAGTGVPGFSGDGGDATQAQLDHPAGVAVGMDGSVYIADTGNVRIRRVDKDGRISTIAGSGQRGASVDDGPALQAQLAEPYGVAVHADGSIYVSDLATHVVRQVKGDQLLRVAGTGQRAFGGEGVPARNAPLSSPRGIAVADDGRLYIADTDNNRIREVDIHGFVRTFLGTNRGAFGGDGGPAANASVLRPVGVGVGPEGSIYVADTGNRRIRKVGADKFVTTVAAGADASEPALQELASVAVARDGTVYVADSDAGQVLTVRASGTIDVLRQPRR